MIYEETPPIHFGTRSCANDSTGQLEGGEYLEAASSLSAARFEAGLLQHGSYAIGCKCETRENSLILEATPRGEFCMPRLLTSLVVSLVIYISLGEQGMRKPV